MNTQIFVQLINNAGLLLSVSVLSQLGHLIWTKRRKGFQYIDGLILSVIVITVMHNPVTIHEGLVFDTRSILLSVSALYLGPIPALMAALSASLFRLAEGGLGTLTGIAVIFSTTAFGLIWRSKFNNKIIKNRMLNRYLFSLLTHVIMLLCMLTLPWDHALITLQKITFPVLVLYPFASLVLCALIQTQEENSQMIQTIKESESLYRSFFENNQAVVLIVDPVSGSIHDANKSAVGFYGYELSVLRSMSISQINSLSETEIKERMALSVSKTQNHFEFKHRIANGEIKNVEVYTGPISIEGKPLLYSIIHDITDRVKAQVDLVDSEIRFKSLVDNAPYAIFIQMERKFYYLNKMACALFGIKSPDELIGEPVMDHFHPNSRQSIAERIKQLNEDLAMVPPVDEQFLRIDNSPVDVTVVAVPYRIDNQNGALVFALDITETKALELKKQEFELKSRQQQKLEAIGTLAGGVAHEINNPINGIMNYAQLILDSIQDQQQTESYAKAIIVETQRISGIVKNLLQFARMEKQSHSYASLYDIVDRTLSLTKVIFKKDDITLDIQLDPDIPNMKCRSQQIQQVLMNLLTNAKDALNERYSVAHPNKIIEMRAHLIEKENRRWIQLSVKDFGIGIDPKLFQKIYEPFFSTKAKEKGTGLGLAISYGIVKEHHGEILTDSVVGQYTQFTLVLPVDNGWDTTEGKHD